MGFIRKSQKGVEVVIPIKKVMQVKDIKIPYTLEKRNVKNSRLEFNQGKLKIILSKKERNEQTLIKEKQRWILKHYFKINEKLNEIRKWHSKDEMMILGKGFQIKKTDEKLSKFDFENHIVFEGKNKKKLKVLFKDLLKSELEKMIEEVGEKLNQHPEGFRIKNQKTAWGSCSSKRNVNFNLKLVFLPQDLIYFVVFHEILHLRYMSHGKRFHAVMKREFGDVKKFEERLNKWWHYVHLDVILNLLNPT